MIPVISIVGRSNSGKTTLLEKIIGELRRRNIKVGTIKHHHYTFDIDTEGKDTWRFWMAGSDSVAISSPSKFALVSRVEKEKNIDEIVRLMGDVDLVITEGYKKCDKPKIELIRRKKGEQPMEYPEGNPPIAFVVDSKEGFQAGDIPVFYRDDIIEIADFIIDFCKLKP